MDLKKKHTPRLHPNRKRRRKGDTDQLAAQLAPLEEQDKPAAEQQIGTPLTAATNDADTRFGAIVVDSEDLKLPGEIVEPEDKHFLGLEPVVLVVLILVLAFIGFIAWQISLMQPKG